jgi:LysM repeat protein
LHGQTNPYLIDLVAYFLVFKSDFKPNSKSITLLEYTDTKGNDLEKMAKLVGVSVSQIKTYNTWLSANSVPKDINYTVYFPANEEQKKQMQEALTKNNTMLPVEQYQQLDYPIVVKKQSINVDGKSYELISANGLEAIRVDNKDKAENVLKVANKINLRKFLKYNEITEKDSVKANTVYYLEEKKKKAATPFHELKKDETFWSISQKYGMRYDKLLDYNRIADNEKEQVGRKLWLVDKRPKETQIEFVPQNPIEIEPVKPTLNTVATNNTQNTHTHNGLSEDEKGSYYTTNNAEVIYDVAAKLRMTLDSLRMLNPDIGTSRMIEAQTKLLIHRKNITQTPNNQVVTKNNDSEAVKDIAQAVIKANSKDGQANLNTSGKAPAELTHTVQKKEWLSMVARKYGVSLEDIMTWNKIKAGDNVKAGDKLIIKNPKQGFEIVDNNATDNKVDNKGIPASSANTEAAKNTTNTTKDTKNLSKKDTIIEQPFLKDSVYLVRYDGETLQTIEKKLNLPKIADFEYSLYMKTWNSSLDPNVPPLEATQVLAKGTTIKLSQNAVLPSSADVAKAMGVNVNMPTNNQVVTNPVNNTVVTDNTANSTTNTATVPNIVTANTEKVVMYADYKDSTYIVGSGDSFYAIARKTGVPDYRYLLRWNGITDQNKKLDIGDRLIVKGDLSQPIVYQPISNGKYHTTQFGENIYTVAKLYNTKADSLAKWNGISADSLLPIGKSLLVRKASFHTVKSGENLKKIAEMYNMKPEELAAWNKMGIKDVIKPNQNLIVDNAQLSNNQGVIAASGVNKDATTAVNTNPEPLKDIYLVRENGETLKTIATKLKLPNVEGSPYYLYMQKWNTIENADMVLAKGTAIKTAENAVMPSPQQIEEAMKNTSGQNSATNTTQNSGNAATNQEGKINQDALLTSPNSSNSGNKTAVADIANNVKSTNSQPFADIHIVRMPNETLQSIAAKYKLQPMGGYGYALYMKTWNIIDDENVALPIGKAIRLTENANMPTDAELAKVLPPPSSQNTSGKHIVTQGETLYTIAQRYNVDKKYLEVWNKIDDDTPLKAGQVLVIQGDMRTETPKYDKFYTDQYHVVQAGETLSEIANFHKLPIETLKSLNNLTDSNINLTEGQQLWIVTKPKVHKVNKGESLSIIAKQYGLSIQDIASFNSVPLDYKTKIGENIIVDAAAILPKPMIKNEDLSVEAPKSGRTETPQVVGNQQVPETYYAQFGENLRDVCARFGVSTIDFKLWNKLKYDADKLEEGRKYYLKMPAVQVNQTPPPSSSGTPTSNGKYKVGKNETLYMIARKFNVTVYQLREWNNLKVDLVKEGDDLVVSKK